MKYALLGEIATIKGGGTPDKSVPEYWNGGIPWASVKDLKSDEISQTTDNVSALGVASSATQIIPAGSIIVPTRMAVGKVAINSGDVAINQDLKAIFPNPDIHTKYLFYAIKNKERQLISQATGATVKGIKVDVLRNLQIPLPPMPEQKRIAAILDQAADLVRLRKEALEKLDMLGHAIFHKMFIADQGLTPSEMIPLSEVVKSGTIVTYGIVQAGIEIPGGIPYIRTSDLKGGVISMNNLRHTTPEIASKFARSRVEEGDIVMSIRATVGTTAIVPRELHGANLTQGTARIAIGNKATSNYLNAYLNSNRAQAWIQRQVKGATFREITLTRLREMPILLPSIEEQNLFSNKIEKICGIKLDAELALDHAVDLMNSLQQRAFKGAL